MTCRKKVHTCSALSRILEPYIYYLTLQQQKLKKHSSVELLVKEVDEGSVNEDLQSVALTEGNLSVFLTSAHTGIFQHKDNATGVHSGANT